ncbi:MAG: 1-acyl-sn-glycerol-3-phosphate acyltransferase [Chloracidobacterium sp.]|nr:1-acyl-sn-glycerol-3-phosphate acyltransferase [Chloracidobacterium sp.]
MSFVRGTLRLAAFVLASLVLYASWWVVSWFVPNKTLWRQVVFHWWSKLFAMIARMELEIVGTPPKPPFFLVSNHVSYVDIPALRLAANGVFVAKSEIKDWFLAGPMIRNMGNIFIDRKNRRDIPRAGAELLKKLNEREGVILFPEGTSTKGEMILPFNSSFLEFAARTDLPVSHAAVRYVTPEGGPTPSERICWWDDTGFLKHLWLLFSLPSFTAVVTFGDETVVDTDRKRLAARLKERVEADFIPML